jgi:hypothetical protein
MRLKTGIAAFALAAAACTAIPALAAEPAAAAAPVSAQPKFSTSTTTLEALMADPAAKTVLVRIVPEFGSTSSFSDNLERASGMTLRELKAAVGAYAPDLLTDARLTQLDEEFAKLPVGQ